MNLAKHWRCRSDSSSRVLKSRGQWEGSAVGVPVKDVLSNDLVQELLETLAGLPSQPGPKIKEFSAEGAAKAPRPFMK